MQAICRPNSLILALSGLLIAGQASASDMAHQGHRPRSHHHHTAPVMQPVSLRLPPAPYSAPAVGDAPVPNENVAPPVDHQKPQANLAPAIFALHYPSSGDGYIGGSSPSTIDNEHASQIGGVQMQLPLE
jgi:hypothetical protein